MKVIFLEHVINVGKQGEVKEVKSGYAMNFLFPKKLAKEFTDADQKIMDKKTDQQEKNRINLLANSADIAKTLSKTTLSFTLPIGQNGKPYWSIKEKDVALEIKKRLKVEISKKKVRFESGHLKTLGEHFIYVDFWDKISSKVKVIIS